MRFFPVLVFLCCFFGSGVARGQAIPDTSLNRVVPDTLPERNAPVRETPSAEQVAYDSLKGKFLAFQPNPKKSALYSAIVPGLGQIYNRQYWKLPIVYGGLAASIYFLVDNTNQYQRFRSAYIARINNPNVQDEFTYLGDATSVLNYVQVNQSAFRKYLDMTILFSGLGYTLQVMDALTFAHLKNFDISPNISVRMSPVTMPNGNPGFGFVMNVKPRNHFAY